MNKPKIPDKNYFFIREVSKLVDVKPHTLRYWENEFKQLRPARRDSGQRKYTKKDIELILEIRRLLYEEKYSIPGAQEYLSKKSRLPKQQALELDMNPARQLLKETQVALQEIVDILKN